MPQPPLPPELVSHDIPLSAGLARDTWRGSATAAVRRAYAADPEQGWQCWRNELASRSRPSSGEHYGRPSPWWFLGGLPEGITLPDWPLGARPPGGESVDDRALPRDVEAWIDRPREPAASIHRAIEAVVIAGALPRLARQLSPGLWWRLLDWLLAMADDAGAIDLKTAPLAHQLLAGELPLTLAWRLPEVRPCWQRRSVARRALSSGLVELLDGEGLPHADWISQTGPLLGCWTRCRAIGEQLAGGCFDRAAQLQYEWLVRQALRLLRPDGTLPLTNGQSLPVSAELLKAALRLGGDEEDWQIAARVLPGWKKQHTWPPEAMPEPSLHSEWAEVAVLRGSWSRVAPRLTVAYASEPLMAELVGGGELLFSAQWACDVRFAGQAVHAASDWVALCWHVDEGVDYLELELELDAGLVLQRQIFLAGADRIALLADAVLAPHPGRIEYASRLPLAPGVEFEAAEQTREGWLVGRERLGRVFPLALPEWREEHCEGELEVVQHQLQWRQTADARRLYAPMLFDLDPKRIDRKATWRRLAVAESLEAQPAEVAVGYRVAVGQKQWLIYRSLAERANRTLLGHNLVSESLIARFRRGKVEPLVEIE